MLAKYRRLIGLPATDRDIALECNTPTIAGLDLAAIEARVNAAMPAPWMAESRHDMKIIFVGDIPGIRPASCILMDGSDIDRSANADFIAHARQDIPALLSALKRSEEVREELVRALESVLESIGCVGLCAASDVIDNIQFVVRAAPMTPSISALIERLEKPYGR